MGVYDNDPRVRCDGFGDGFRVGPVDGHWSVQPIGEHWTSSDGSAGGAYWVAVNAAGMHLPTRFTSADAAIYAIIGDPR